MSRPLRDLSPLELIAASLLPSSERVPQSQVREVFFDQPPSWVLDPVAEAAKERDIRYWVAAQAIAAESEARARRPVDRGAAAMDVLTRRLLAGTRVNDLIRATIGPGAVIQPNLSGFRQEGRSIYPIAPGVTYERATQQAKVGDGRGGVVEFVRLNDTPMADWDIPDRYHSARNVTVRHLGDVEELMRERLRNDPSSSMRLYITPGGFRAWELSQRGTPEEYAKTLGAMKVDEDYVRIAQQPVGGWEVEGMPVGGTGFSSRISAKPGRLGDWVAQPLLTMRGAESQPDPTSLERVDRFHDEPIRRAYLGPDGVSRQALAALQGQAATASQALRSELTRRRLLR